MNLYSGTAQLWKMVDLGLEFTTPAGGWDGLYLPYASIAAKIEAIRDDPLGSGVRDLTERPGIKTSDLSSSVDRVQRRHTGGGFISRQYHF